MSTEQPPVHFVSDRLIVPLRVLPPDRQLDGLPRVAPHGMADGLPLGRGLLSVDLGHLLVDDFNS
jgi:hypothetical protein